MVGKKYWYVIYYITYQYFIMYQYFLGPNGIRFASAISGPKKVSIFRAHPFQCPS
jgi:hypothetical protein